MEKTFVFSPTDFGDELSVTVTIEATGDDDYDFEMLTVEDSEGQEVSLEALTQRDRDTLDKEVELFAAMNAYEAYCDYLEYQGDALYDRYKDDF